MNKKKEYRPIKWYIECKYCKYDFIRNIGFKCPRCNRKNNEHKPIHNTRNK